MDIEAVLNSIDSRIRDNDQSQRIKQLAERLEAAFGRMRAQGVKNELEHDWTELKAKFDAALKLVQKETGLY